MEINWAKLYHQEGERIISLYISLALSIYIHIYIHIYIYIRFNAPCGGDPESACMLFKHVYGMTYRRTKRRASQTQTDTCCPPG